MRTRFSAQCNTVNRLHTLATVSNASLKEQVLQRKWAWLGAGGWGMCR